MFYLSRSQFQKLSEFSRDIIEKNGWRDQFAVTNRILMENYIAITNLNMGLQNTKPSKYEMTKGIVDILIVVRHPMNILKIDPREIKDVAFKDYVCDGKTKEAKIPRIYKRVLNIDNYKPTKDLDSELNKMASQVVESAQKKYGPEYGKKFQTNRTKEELLELARELDNYERFQSTAGSRDFAERCDSDNRMNIIDEMFDAMYTIRYLMIACNISDDAIRKLFNIRLKQVSFRELGR
jgi:hypothetical protein